LAVIQRAAVMTRAKRGVLSTVVCAVALIIAACDTVSIRGQEINVLLPYQVPGWLVAEFTRETGVTVSVKLIVANTAKTYVADVTELDWSFTGQFAAAGWYEPLAKVLDPVLMTDLSQADAAFKDFKPLFTDPGSAGYRALRFEVDALKNGWASPGSVTLDNGPAFDKFAAGSSAILLATSPSNLATANDPEESSIAPNAKPALVPGVLGPGMLPCRGSVVTSMAQSGELDGGTILSVEAAFKQLAAKATELAGS
jgi:hypothetical protein